MTSSSSRAPSAGPGLDAAVLRLRPSYRGLAVSLDGQGRIAALDPFTGGALAILESARNVACTGGEPLGFTDCLNFGNPEKAEVGWQLSEVIEGMARACEALGLPIVSGNVSLYNDTDGRSIHPTPVVGCVGLVADVRRVPRGWQEGDVILLASAGKVSLAGSEYQARYGTVGGVPPALDLAAEAALVDWLRRIAPRASLAHDAAEGGLAVALAEAAIFSGVGAVLDLERRRDRAVRRGGRPGDRRRSRRIRSRSIPPARRSRCAASASSAGAEILGAPVAELRAAWESGR